jgi:hypothetical protein
MVATQGLLSEKNGGGKMGEERFSGSEASCGKSSQSKLFRTGEMPPVNYASLWGTEQGAIPKGRKPSPFWCPYIKRPDLMGN